MSIRVVNRKRWRRAKIQLGFSLWLIAIGCHVAGFRPDVGQRLPMIVGFWLTLASSMLLAQNVFRKDHQRGR